MWGFRGSRKSPGLIGRIAAAGMACLMCCQLGCGGGAEGPARYDLTGSVAYDGNPVPFGQIIFAPDSSAGNSGPQGVADIRAGRYDTGSGKGTVGGPHIAKITGFDTDPAAGTEENPVAPLFVGYETKVDLPKADGTQDFSVPARGKQK